MRLIDADQLKKEMEIYCPLIAKEIVDGLIDDAPTMYIVLKREKSKTQRKEER